MARVKASEQDTFQEPVFSWAGGMSFGECVHCASYLNVQLAARPAKHVSLPSGSLAANPFQLGTKTRPVILVVYILVAEDGFGFFFYVHPTFPQASKLSCTGTSLLSHSLRSLSRSPPTDAGQMLNNL